MPKGVFSKLIIVLMVIAIVLFTLKILQIVEQGIQEPTALIYAVFGLVTGEFGFMAIIKSVKVKNKNESEDK